jgi:glyoxylase-like metal-dependent hydrolase (beta-lactamase superfamily II)
MKNRLIFLISIAMATISAKAQDAGTILPQKTGDYQVYLLSEGQNKGNAGILIGASPEMIAEQIPDGTFPMATNVILIQTPDKNILVDTGYGRLLPDNLTAVGLDPKQIDVVLITHMHGDHIGGLLKNGQSVFPNAQLYIAQPEHDYWLNANNENAINVIKEYADRLALFEPNELGELTNELLPGITPLATYGHTPGHTSFLVESGDDKLLIWGDLAHAMAIQMPYPQVAVTYDVNPEEAVRSREAVLKYVSENKIPVAGMHIAYPGIGDIKPASGSGYTFIPR